MPAIILKFEQIISNFLSSGVESEEMLIGLRKTRRIKFVNGFSFLGMLALFGFGLVNGISGQTARAIVEIGGGFVSLVNLLMLRRTKNVDLASTIILVLMLFVMLFLLLEGGIAGTGVFWLFTFPALALFMKGKNDGLLWMLSFFSLLAVPPVLEAMGYSPSHTGIELTQLFASLLITSGIIYVFSFFSDRDEVILIEQYARLNQAVTKLTMFRQAVDSASDQIVITDSDGIVIYANDALQDITGFSPAAVVGNKAGDDLWGKLMSDEFYENMWRIIKVEKREFEGEIRNRRIDGSQYDAQVHISPILDDKGEVEFFVAIERDITKQKEVDRLKTDFVSLASHELRTPLSAIKWFLEMFLNGELGKLTEEQKDYLMQIFQSNERMITLVNALLNISKIEEGRLEILPEPIDLKKLVEDVIGQCEPLAKDKNVTLVVSANDRLKPIMIDEKLITQALMNVISNAIKYSPKDGEVTIFVSTKDEEVIIEISDLGIGIPREDQARIFDKFFRASNAVKHDSYGNGLGLYLTKVVIESSGGRVWFESKEGKGTTFWLTLPKSGSQKVEYTPQLATKEPSPQKNIGQKK